MLKLFSEYRCDIADILHYTLLHRAPRHLKMWRPRKTSHLRLICVTFYVTFLSHLYTNVTRHILTNFGISMSHFCHICVTFYRFSVTFASHFTHFQDFNVTFCHISVTFVLFRHFPCRIQQIIVTLQLWHKCDSHISGWRGGPNWYRLKFVCSYWDETMGIIM